MRPPRHRPPRAFARSAERSSSTATSSSGPRAASARCQARRSGSLCGSVTSARARCTPRRSDADADRYTTDRTRGWRNLIGVPNSTRSASVAGVAASAPIPSSAAARHTKLGSPAVSAAATNSRCRVGSGRASRRRRKLSSAPPANVPAPGSPNPPANSSGVSPRGSSSNANGFPRVSATSRSRIWASSGAVSSASSSASASAVARPVTGRCGSPARWVLGTRAV